MWDFITGLWEAFIPPLDASPAAQYNWRIRVGVFTCIAFTGVSTLTAVAYGLVPGISGFELASQAQAQSNAIIVEIRSNRAESLANELLNLRIKHCAAVKANNEDAKIRYWAEIQTRMVKYQQLTNQVWPLPACTDL